MPGLSPQGGPPNTTGGPRAPIREGTRRRVHRVKTTGTAHRTPRTASRKDTGTTLRLATWNVRTMTTGLTDDLRKVSDSPKVSVINNELKRLNIDIAALQETRLREQGSITEGDYTFFWCGKGEKEKREHGVGFAVSNKLLKMVEPGDSGTERIYTMKLYTKEGTVNLISAYSPTLCASDDSKDQFYDDLHRLIKSLPSQEIVVLLGDLNARVGTDHESWPVCLGHYGVGKLNSNRQRLLELCTYHKLCISNTFFHTRNHHKVSWRHPRSKCWHLMDYILTRREHLSYITQTRAYQSADCDTDHSLICCNMKLHPTKLHRTKNPGKPKIDTSRISDPEAAKIFKSSIREELLSAPKADQNVSEQWSKLRETIYGCAKTAFGTKRREDKGWFQENATTMIPLIEEKREALLKNKKCPTRLTGKALKAARRKCQRKARQCANNYWLTLANQIQVAADTGNIRAMYAGIKKAVGPNKRKTAPLKSKRGEVITDKAKQMDRWKEHYAELLSTETSITAEALQSIETLPCMSELDNLPTKKELSDALDCMTSGKAPGMDGIPPELLKCGKDVLIDELHDLLCNCWNGDGVPQDMRDCKINTLYKNKGDMSDCNNYRGIALLSVVGKLFARVVLMRLQKLAERVYPESQCGFRAERSTIDMIFSLRQLQEKCREQRKPLYMAFIDLTKAFDLVSRNGLFQILDKIGCPPKLLNMVKSFHVGMKGFVQFDGMVSSAFDITSGVKQGCVLAPTLFGIFFSVMLKQAFGQSSEGVYLHSRSSGGLFNLSRLKAKTKRIESLIRELLFADDAAIVSHSEEELQSMMEKFSNACRAFGLTISIKKTKVMVQGTEDSPEILVDGTALDVEDDFTYLGSVMSNDLSLEKELNRRIGRACNTFARLTERVWENSKLTINTKIAVYKACVLSTLLYGSESWTLYSHQQNKLEVFHMKHLRLILNIRWDDYITNTEVLEKAKIFSLHTILLQRRLRWLGHVHRMPEERIPKKLLYGQLADGSRSLGRPHLRFRDVCKRDLENTGIGSKGWERLASNRSQWRSEVYKGMERAEKDRHEKAAEKRERRKEKKLSTPIPSAHICNRCGRDCHAPIGLASHVRSCKV